MFESIQWEAFIDQQNLELDRVEYEGGFYTDKERFVGLRRTYKREWDKGLFIGNGMVGSMIYKDSPQVMMWELGRNDVVAHNFLEGIDWATPRVPIGHVLMRVKSEIVNESMSLKLWNAQVEGMVTTLDGDISWQSWCHYDTGVTVIEAKSNRHKPSSEARSHMKLEDIEFSFRPEHGVSPRVHYAKANAEMFDLPPMPEQKQLGKVQCSIQEFVNNNGQREGACVVAYREIQVDANTKRLFVGVVNENEREKALLNAVDLVESAVRTSYETYRNAHRDWWHNYYPRSYINVPDAYWNQFYWIQIYKLACAVREDGVILDSQGPWLTYTPWPTTVWNLNVQYSYYPLYQANRGNLAMSLVKGLKANKRNLINNAKPLGIEDGMYISRATSPINLTAPWPDTYELGNLTWALYNVWMHYEMTGDKDLLKELLYPYLRANVRSYEQLLSEDAEGILHLNDTSSPEYPSVGDCNWHPIKDCTYSLALLRWALETLIKLSGDRENSVMEDLSVEIQHWQRILEQLVPYPVDENGFMIGSEIPMAKSHRHFSHLFMVWPLRQMGRSEADNDLVNKSIEHWLSFEDALQGYTYTSASLMMATMGNGNRALTYLEGLKPFLSINTMYAEKGPVIETPLSVAACIQEMCLNYLDGCIHVFPAVPDKWREMTFADLLMPGGFQVSGVMKDGMTSQVQVKSTRGGRVCLLINGKNYEKEMTPNEVYVMTIDEYSYE